MSAGGLFELIRPTVLVVCAVASSWVLASSRDRFPLYQSILWSIGSFVLPLVFLPLYLVVLLLTRRPKLHHIKGRLILPLIYLVAMLAAIAFFLQRENSSVDAYLAGAQAAKV